MLSQKQTNGQIAPIAYPSQTLQQHETRYGISELEVSAVVWATKNFRAYLYTDHEALQALLNTSHLSGKPARWGMALQEMDLHLHYQPGKTNQNTGTLSCTPIGAQADTCRRRREISSHTCSPQGFR